MVVRSGFINKDEHHGSVVPPIHLSSIYNFLGYNQARGHDYYRRNIYFIPRNFLRKLVLNENMELNQ
ncbi:MAG: hypothetical protein V6006_00445 [Candidatus Dasytiphilus stammeri]